MKDFSKTPIAVAVLSTLLATNVSAQQSETTVQTDKKVEKISVTGSRIKGVDAESSSPLIVLDADAIAKSGASTISELLQQVSQTRGGEGSFSTAESGATSTSTPAGQAAASLRGLGPSSTLTLINGRRIAASSFAAGTQNFVDVNSIPLAAIERIEVLATGASAIYGADAVAGVINYILKKDYQGAEINISSGNSFAGSDEGKSNINLMFGTELAGGQLTVFADHYDRNGFNAGNRKYTARPVLESGYSYLPKDYPNIYYFSARDGNEIANPNCPTNLVTTEYGERICAYYGNEDDSLISPFESSSVGFVYNQEFDDITWNTDFFYSSTKSTAVSRPAPINRVDDTEGPWVDESALDIYPEDVRDALLDNMYIDPFDTINGRTLYGFAFDARFGTPRTVEAETKSYRLVTSLSGLIGDWDWETAFTLSKSESDQVATAGVYNRYKYHAAIGGELCSDGSIASYDADADLLSCNAGNLMPMYNPFLVGNADNDALLALAQERPVRNGESTVYGWDARVTGDLFEFNGEIVSAAFGLETRKEEINDVPSLNVRAQASNDYLVDVFGFGSSLSEAERTQYGAFAEFYVPLADNLEMQLAGRYDDYDDFGDTFNSKIGFAYRPVEELILRATWATSFRAPSLTQAGVKLRTTTAAFDCGSNQAVADLYCEGDGVESSVNVLELGNPLLKAEESDSLSFGIGYSPTENTTITLDYWQFKHENLVDTDMTAVLAAAIADNSLRHCGLVPQGQTGISYEEDLCLVTDEAGLTIEQAGADLSQILDAWVAFDDPRRAELPLYRDHVIELTNTGEQNVSGLDFKFSHYFEISGGSASFALDATHYLEFERNRPGSDTIEDLVGTWRYPENIANLRFNWAKDALYTGVTVQYTGSYLDDIEGLRGRQIDELRELDALNVYSERKVASWTTVNAHIGYDFENYNIDLSVNNMFDRGAPVAYGSSRGFDSINHNAFGATWRLSFTYFFK